MDYNQNVTNSPQPQQGKGLAIASMVLGIVSIVLCCCFYYLAFPCGILALIFGIIVIKNKRLGKGMAIAGIITSSVALVFAVLLIAFASVLLANLPWSELMNY